jgi:hypothetical protein
MFSIKEILMSKHSPRIPIFRRLWKPAVATSAGGTATVIWLDEILRYGEEILALVFLPLMAAGIYLFDNFIFKSRTPRAEDTKNTNEKRS